jgi:Uma2 family endonuclease
MPARVGLTYSDYAALPDDGRRYELHRGELSVTPAPGTRHQRAVVSFTVRLAQYVRSQRLGEVFVSPTDCILSDVTVVQPDVLYVAADRQAIISERGIEGAPTLAVEVLSASTTRIDRERKLALYAEHGVPYYWIADPENRTIEAYRLAAGAYAAAGSLTTGPAALPPFPDLLLDPAELWP